MGSQQKTMGRATIIHLVLIAIVPLIKCQPTSSIEDEVIRQVEMVKSVRAIADRDMHIWWGEYDNMMADYKSKRNASICTEEEMLADLLDDISNQVEKVRFGWTQKQDQLQTIRDILEDDHYKNVTGLHNALNEYITEQDEQAMVEDGRLKEEEAEVAFEKNLLRTHPCPCVWGEWEAWGECTVSCGAGNKTRDRQVAKNATNGGDEWDGSSPETTSCGSGPCPIDCLWGSWGEWSDCSTECGDGTRERHRVHAILAEFGGQNCTGEIIEEKSCNVLEETKHKVAEQEVVIEDLQKQLKEQNETKSLIFS